MKLLAIILTIFLSSCFTGRYESERKEKAVLVCFIPEEGNRTILKLQTEAGKTVRDFKVGDKYIVHFNRMDRVIKITKAE